MQEKKKIFALDIGTRTIIGIILESDDRGGYRVLDLLEKEHEERAILKGQIHHVPAVTKGITHLKKMLEHKHGPLQTVSVAAAGRALKTRKTFVTVSIAEKPHITNEDIWKLELQTVQKVQKEIANEDAVYCVGYSVLHYFLNGEKVSSLLGQQGVKASIEIIATFLPKTVIDSLLISLEQAKLKVEALTLEPIAAIHALTRPSMRTLNIALVDIGAGTSDIAITAKRTIIAYGMVSIAGDDITEAMSNHYLLDFSCAEKAKRALTTNEQVIVPNIFGKEIKILRKDMVKEIAPTIDQLAQRIAMKILQLNNEQIPKAVMLIGGGSLTPHLSHKIAHHCHLPENRIQLLGPEAIKNLTIDVPIKTVPQYVTPIGIALTAKQSAVPFITVYVNKRAIHLFKFHTYTVQDCLVQAGMKMEQLYGKRGKAMLVSINGTTITLPGEDGKPPTIKKNGKSCNLDDPVMDNDHVIALYGTNGEEAKVSIAELIGDSDCKTVFINDRQYNVPLQVKKNGRHVPLTERLKDKDVIETYFPKTIEALLQTLHLNDWLQTLKPLRVTINDQTVYLPTFKGKIYVNNEPSNLSTIYKHHDQLQLIRRPPLIMGKLAEIRKIKWSKQITIYFHSKPICLRKQVGYFYRNGHRLHRHTLIHHGDRITFQMKKSKPFIFQDILEHVDIRLPKEKNRRAILTRNKKEISFSTPLSNGDKLEIIWSKEKNTKKTRY